MNEDLLKTLLGLRTDPTLAVVLYKQLFMGRYWVLVQKPVGSIESMSFLTYPTQDKIRELPAFTASDRRLVSELASTAGDAEGVQIEGSQLWPRMLDVVKTRECEVAIDPGEKYSIRLTREMILGMVIQYGSKQVRE